MGFWNPRRAKRVQQIKYEAVSEEALKGSFRIDVETEQGDVILIARELPRKWKLDAPINEVCSFTGFFIGNQFNDSAAQEKGDKRSVFVSLRPRWFPDASSAIESSDSLKASYQALAERGVDIGRLDYVRRQSFRRLTGADNQSFYQMLAATREMTSTDVPEVKLSFLDLMRNPRTNFGHATYLSGRVRRCFRVEVKSEELRQRYGVDHYYELDMFHYLENGTVTTEDKDRNKIVFEDRFPMTVCVAQLPEGMSPEDVADHTVQVKGFYYRFWSYHSEFSAEQSEKIDKKTGKKTDKRLSTQASPLVIGVVAGVTNASSESLDWMLTGFVIALFLAAAGAIWFFRRSDQQFKNDQQRKAKPEELDFSGINE